MDRRTAAGMHILSSSRLARNAAARSAVYRVVYLMALTTGLRRGELKALRWGDIHLNAARPFLAVRASISKNHKTATMFLRQDVADALRELVGADTDNVLDMPGRKRFKSHLLAAGIQPQGADGRVVDFHALRHSFITGLSKAGVSPRVAMELARHSQIDLTMRVYTDGGLLGSADAVNSLPQWTRLADPDSQKNLATGTLDDRGTTGGTTGGTKTGSLRLSRVPSHAHVAESARSGEPRIDTAKTDDSLAFNQSGRQDTNRTFRGSLKWSQLSNAAANCNAVGCRDCRSDQNVVPWRSPFEGE